MIKYNVIYDKQKDINTLLAELESSGVVIDKVFSNIGVLTLSAENTSFTSIDGVLLVEEDLQVTAEESYEWHQLRIVSNGLPMKPTYLVSNYGEGVDVYVVDSGIDGTHVEFSHTTINNLFSYDDNFTPTSGHGTAVASVIGGNTLGISKNTKLHNVKIPTGTSTTYSVLLSAFDAILNYHDASKVAIVNCSWTVPKSLILDTKITELQNDNLVVVAAAGNMGVAADDFSPVGLNSVLGVGASDAYDRVISWGGQSNWGPEVDLFAPGIDVVVADMGGTTTEVSGTSIAAGVVSGVVAQYIVENPTLTASQIQSLVIQQAKDDMLFRNESIYGTTPNKLVAASVISRVVTNIPEKINVQKGTTQTFTVEFNSTYVQSLQFTNLTVNDGRVVKLPSWVSVSDNTLTFSPTEDLNSAKYMIPIRAIDYNGDRIETAQLIINVYQTTPEENDEGETYRYFATDINSEVVVTLANCFQYTCFNSFGICYKADFPCFCNTGFQCYTIQGT